MTEVVHWGKRCARINYFEYRLIHCDKETVHRPTCWNRSQRGAHIQLAIDINRDENWFVYRHINISIEEVNLCAG